MSWLQAVKPAKWAEWPKLWSGMFCWSVNKGKQGHTVAMLDGHPTPCALTYRYPIEWAYLSSPVIIKKYGYSHEKGFLDLMVITTIWGFFIAGYIHLERLFEGERGEYSETRNGSLNPTHLNSKSLISCTAVSSRWSNLHARIPSFSIGISKGTSRCGSRQRMSWLSKFMVTSGFQTNTLFTKMKYGIASLAKVLRPIHSL